MNASLLELTVFVHLQNISRVGLEHSSQACQADPKCSSPVKIGRDCIRTVADVQTGAWLWHKAAFYSSSTEHVTVAASVNANTPEVWTAEAAAERCRLLVFGALLPVSVAASFGAVLRLQL